MLLTQYVIAANKLGFGADFGLNAVKKLENMLRNGYFNDICKNFGATAIDGIGKVTASEDLKDISKNFGQNIGLGTLTTVAGTFVMASKSISSAALSGGAKILACGKTVETVIIASPATPYVMVSAGIVAVGYVIYKVYRYYNPMTGDVIEKMIKIAQLDEAKAKSLCAQARLKEAQARLNKADADLKKSEIELHNAALECTSKQQ